MAELVYLPVIGALRVSFAVLGLRIDVRGSEHVPRTGGAVLVSNHVSYLDFVFAGLAARRSRRYVRFMAKESIWRSPVAGPLMRGMRHIPVDRAAGSESFKAALRDLRAGEVVGVFPEATISESFELKEFKSGAVRLAQAAGVPVVPVVLWGSQRMMTKGRPRDFSRGTAVSVTAGEPLSFGRRDDSDAATAQVRERMRVMLDDAMARYPQQPSGPDDRWWVPARLGGTAPLPESVAATDEG